MLRESKVERKTQETEVSLWLRVDGTGIQDIQTSIPFMDHMLSQFAKHSLFDLTIKSKGDLAVDFHHTVEDIGICFGKALEGALGNKVGIKRYGHSFIPMDEALVLVAVDLSGRPYFNFKSEVNFSGDISNIPADLLKEFFRAFSNNGRFNIHINIISGENLHHIWEAVFKAASVAIKIACSIDKKIKGIPSTKGTLI